MPPLFRPPISHHFRPLIPRRILHSTTLSPAITAISISLASSLSDNFFLTSSPSSPPFRSASSSAASTRWKTRQSGDPYTRASKLAGLKSRAAYKLLEIDARHRLFRPGDTVVDLGYAPGSWTQVAVSRVRPRGRVVGLDVIPAQPPRGANALQGDFLREDTRARLREFLREPGRGRVRGEEEEGRMDEGEAGLLLAMERDEGLRKDAERRTAAEVVREGGNEGIEGMDARVGGEGDEMHGEEDASSRHQDRVVDVVLSDMSAPWPFAPHAWVKSVSNPYFRMMNTSGMPFRDHAGSMDLCLAALDFCYDTLVTGGHFLCKFYAGAEDHALEIRLKKLFDKVHRIKPDSSRKESREAYFVGLRRKADVPKEVIFGDT